MTNRGRWVINGEQVCVKGNWGKGGGEGGRAVVCRSVGREEGCRMEERKCKD